MDSNEQQYPKEKFGEEEEQQGLTGKTKSGEIFQNHLLKQQPSSTPASATSSYPASPPSSTSSPSHEFSFTISLHHHHHHHQNNSPSLLLPRPSNNYNNTTKPLQQTQTNGSSNVNDSNLFAIDLSPADDIFFHGHLLPLRLISHLPRVSPRSSTNSVDNFTLPVRDLIDDHRNEKSYSDSNILQKKNNICTDDETKGRIKSKSFSLFGLPRRRKGGGGGGGGYEVREAEDRENKINKSKRFDVNEALKRYLRKVRPLLSSFKGFRNREKNRRFDREDYNSFSGNLSFRDKKLSHEFTRGRRRGEYSAPASIGTSPANSGLLIATPTTSVTSSTSDSTMEELQAAIQAAIAHCKKSCAGEDKIQCKN